MVIWEASLCGSGLEKSTKEAIGDHLDAQGAMNAAEYKKKKVNIWNDITVFLQRKEMRWRGDHHHKQTHLFGSGKEQQKMEKYCGGKKVGAEYYILMLKPRSMMQDEESA